MHIYHLTLHALETYLESIGEKKSKAPLIFQGLYRHGVSSILELPIINTSLKRQLATDFSLTFPVLLQQINGNLTTKFLFSLKDHNVIEAVVMRQPYGNTLCISSQVGCNMGCTFCQSGRLKKIRNLQPEEFIAQVMVVQQRLQIKISNVVLMGIGEPFDNYENVMHFLEILQNPYGLALGPRHITVSTCGLAPAIVQYAQHPYHGLLAISLHAPNDALRNQLMPINHRYPIAQLLDAAKEYLNFTNKKVMLEYIMLHGINDTPQHAQQLAQLLGTHRFHVNLIPYNETQTLDFAQSSQERILAFYDILKNNHILVTIRREFGSSVNAACGQLRANYLQK